jgi:hypothetical protein
VVLSGKRQTSARLGDTVDARLRAFAQPSAILAQT